MNLAANGESWIYVLIKPAFISLLENVEAQQTAVFVHAVIRAVLALVFDNPEAALNVKLTLCLQRVCEFYLMISFQFRINQSAKFCGSELV